MGLVAVVRVGGVLLQFELAIIDYVVLEPEVA